jgi:hypothetical protein
MNHATQGLQIHAHKLDGSVAMFTQSEAGLVNRALNEFHPSRIFNQDKITIAGDRAATTFVSSSITRVDLITDRLSVWDFPFVIGASLELSETEFQEFLYGRQWRLQPQSPGDVPMFLKVEMANGQSVFLWMEVIAGYPADRLLNAGSLFKTRSLVFGLRAGGVGVLNPANIACVTLHPDSLKEPVELWPKREAGTSKSGHLTGDLRGLVNDKQPLSHSVEHGLTYFTTSGRNQNEIESQMGREHQ